MLGNVVERTCFCCPPFPQQCWLCWKRFEAKTSTLNRGEGGGEEKMRRFHQCVNVPRVLTGVVGSLSEEVKKLKQVIEISERAKTRERNRERCEGGEDRRSWCVDLDQRCVRKKFQIYLADVIVNEKHRPEVAQLLSDIAEKIRSNSSSPLQALETVLGDSSVKFFNRFECQTGHYCILNCSQGSQTKPGKRYLTSAS